MKSTQKTTTNPTVQDLNAKLEQLLKEAKAVNKEIAQTNKETTANMNDINADVDESINKLKKNFSDLDQIEKKAGDDLDRLILEEAEALAKE